MMTAAEVARSFAEVLREAERGETIVVTRGGKRVAVITSAPAAQGRAVKAFLARSASRVDTGFEADVAAVREADGDGMRSTWPDA
ncbi:type II toxin-antitoxin system Phd/YefM family antitoxin [[Actinomadura] parvosata]|nr:type II toxin-antitoxin system prevent-host-death family antitoxin [Nonomuraea sp. ATCC 55076]